MARPRYLPSPWRPKSPSGVPCWPLMAKPLPLVEPMPPRAGGLLPWVGGGVGLLRHPSVQFERLRVTHGDTFVLDALGTTDFSVSSLPKGVRALYAQPEETGQLRAGHLHVD
jgi:hypothetical protein